jgi:hypothetical protein
MATRKSTTIAADLAADSPLSLDELRAANAARTLAGLLAAMTPKQRLGAAALLAESTGRDVSSLLALFGRLVEEATPAPTPPAAPALPRRPRAAQLVASESNPRLFYIVRDHGRTCTCPGFRFHGRCKHSRAAVEQRRAQIAQLIVRARRQMAA